MAEKSGKDGHIVLSGADVTVHSWTMSYIADSLETTNFDNSTGGNRNYISGLKSWSGTYDCYYSTGNTAIPGSTGQLTMRVTTGVGWNGYILITGMDISVATDGIITQSYTFQGCGALGTTA